MPPGTEGGDDDNGSIKGINQFATPFNKPMLALVDSISFFTFALIGKSSHSGENAISVSDIFNTAFPFLTTWFVTSPFTGVYQSSKDIAKGPKWVSALRVTVQGWIVAVPLGCALRGVIKGYSPPLPFVAVAMASTLVILGLGRTVYAIADKTSNENADQRVDP